MKLLPFYILPLLLLGACKSTTHRTYDERPVIEDKTLMSVPVDGRDDINKERTALAEANDRVLLAKSEVERAEERLEIAKKEVDVAETELESADDRLELAYRGNES